MADAQKSTSPGPWAYLLRQACNVTSDEALITTLLTYRAALISNGVASDELPGIKVIRQWGTAIPLGPNLRQKSCQFLLRFCLAEHPETMIRDPDTREHVVAEIRGSSAIKSGTIRKPVDLLSRLIGAEIDIRKRVTTTKAFQEGLYIIYRKDEATHLKMGRTQIVAEMLYVTSAGPFGVRIYVINRHNEVFAGYLYPSEDAFYMLLGRPHQSSSFRLRAIFCPYALQERKNNRFLGVMIRYSDAANSTVATNVIVRSVDVHTNDDEAIIHWLNRPEKIFLMPVHMQNYVARVTRFYSKKIYTSDLHLLEHDHASVLRGLHPTEF